MQMLGIFRKKKDDFWKIEKPQGRQDTFIVLILKSFKYSACFPNNTLHSRDNSHTSFEFNSRSSARHITKHVFRRPSVVKTSSSWSVQKLPTVLRDCQLSTLSLLFSTILIRMKSQEGFKRVIHVLAYTLSSPREGRYSREGAGQSTPILI